MQVVKFYYESGGTNIANIINQNLQRSKDNKVVNIAMLNGSSLGELKVMVVYETSNAYSIK